jgi:predicted transcriptional regulator
MPAILCRMGTRKPLDLLGPTERAVLQVLWETGPQRVREVYKHYLVARPDAAYTTILTTLQELYAKGLVARARDKSHHVYTAVPKADILAAAFERQFAELGATDSDRAQIVEALRRG